MSLQEPVEIGKRIGLACLPREGAALQMRDALMVQIFHSSQKVFEKQCNEKLSVNPGGVGSQLKQHRCAGPSSGDFNQLSWEAEVPGSNPNCQEGWEKTLFAVVLLDPEPPSLASLPLMIMHMI